MKQIEEQFNLIAKEYDSGRRKFIPCFDEFYEKTTAFVASFADSPRRIADLGAGTGLLSMYYFCHFPEAEYILTDIAFEMLQAARKRFAGAEKVCCKVLDYLRDLPEGNFDLIISALSIHHLEDDEKVGLFRRIKNRLVPGCWFVNYDQFCYDSPEMDEMVNQHWLDHLYNNSGLSAKELELWQDRRKLDRECSVETEISMLRNAGFSNVDCIYLCGKFAVIAAQV